MTRSIAAIAGAVREGKVSAVDVARAALDRIAAGNGAINAATRLLAERGLAEAAQVDAQVAAGRDPGPLAGVPYGVKDLFDVAGYPTGCGNPWILAASGIKRTTAPTIQKLLDAGATFVGKTQTDEIAYSLFGANPRLFCEIGEWARM